MATEALSAHTAPMEVAAADAPFERPYSPSWLDRLRDAIARSPGPTWLAYLVGFVVAAILFNVGAWTVGDTPVGTFDITQSFFGLALIGPTMLLQYLDGIAGRSWDAFRPTTDMTDREAANTRYELTVAPARDGYVILIAGYLITVLWFAADPVSALLVGRDPTYIVVRVIVEGFISSAILFLIYHTVRQLRIVGRLHRSVRHFDLLQPRPTNALAKLTLRSAVVILVLAVLFSLPLPGLSDQAWVEALVFGGLPMIGLALVVFVVPLRGLHGRMIEEKEAMLGALGARLEATMQALHRAIDREATNEADAEASRVAQTRIDALNMGLSSLLQERDLLSRLPTWPWDAGTLRGMVSAVVSAILLPIGLFLLTHALEPLVQP